MAPLVLRGSSMGLNPTGLRLLLCMTREIAFWMTKITTVFRRQKIDKRIDTVPLLKDSVESIQARTLLPMQKRIRPPRTLGQSLRSNDVFLMA
jgi:hypothetical protein